MTESMLTGSWPSYDSDEIRAVAQVLESGTGNYWFGDQCRRFEEEYAAHCRTRYGIALANGSVALELALEAAGIGSGDEVVVTPRSFIASASCVIRVGASPVFADVDPDSQNITPESVAEVLTPATKAIIAVHLAGWPCDMSGLMNVAKQRGLVVIEDCAQAHGAAIDRRPVGGFGHIGVFSFCHDKIITTGGEGGLLVTDDEVIWRSAWSIKDHGKDYDEVHRTDAAPGFRWLHSAIGTNWRMTEMQAAIGRVQLGKLDAWHARRTANAKRLIETLNQYPCVRVPVPPANIEHAYYRLYAFVEPAKLKNGWSRDSILTALKHKKMPYMSGSCPEIYREKAFQDRGLGRSEPLPVAAALGETSLAFVVHPTLTDADMDAYCSALDEILSKATA